MPVGRLGAAAIASAVVFTLGWVLAALVSSTADTADGSLSDLGARTADAPWVWNAARAVSGLLLVVVALGLRRRLPAGRRVAIATALLALLGIADVLGGLAFHTDCRTTEPGCDHDREYSWRNAGHELIGPFGSVGLAVSLALFASTFRVLPQLRVLHAATVATLVAFVVTLAAYVARADDAGVGIVQRVSATVIYAWIVLVALRLERVEPGELRSSERPRPRVRRMRRPPARPAPPP